MRFFTAQKQFQGVLPAVALLCSAAASFLPYSVELPLGVAALLLADHAVCIRDENRPGWVSIAVMAGSALSAGLTIVLLIGHVLGVAAVIEALNLLVMPLYPLAPLHDTADSYETMVSLFAQVCSENESKKIVLMGDSAGGGYSLALVEGLAAHGLRQPDELILLSPWVDVTMSNPQIADYVDVDPALTVTMGRMSGEAWAGALPTDDWHVSPIYGDLSALKNVSIFVGTRELFYPDDTLLYEKLRDNENVNLYIGKGMNHVYPAFPTLEGRAGVQQIIHIIQR